MGHNISKYNKNDNKKPTATTTAECAAIESFHISLPFEIIENILENIALEDKETLLQCQLVCKRSYQLVLKRIYRSVDLTTEQYSPGKLIRKIKSDPTIGEMVEEIKFDNWTLDSNFFAEYCPNVRSLFCYQSPKYFSTLIAQLKKGAWKKMNNIQIPATGYSEEYATIALEIRDRLTRYAVYDEIEVPYWETTILSKKTHHQLAQHLVLFPKLQYVEFFIFQAKHIFEFDKYLDDCANSLNKVKISTVCPKAVLEDNQGHFHKKDIMHHFPNVKQRPQVKQLQAQITLSSDDSLIYLMHKFPSLLYLELNAHSKHTRQDTLNRQCSTYLSEHTITSFLLYLSNIPRFRVGKFYMKNACTLLHIPINAITTSTGAKCRFMIDYQKAHSTMGYDQHPCVNISRPEQDSNIALAIDIYIAESNVELPHLYLLESAGQQVHQLELSLGGMMFLEEHWNTLLDQNISKVLNGMYFSHLMTYCPQLHELNIRSCTLLDYGSNYSMKHTKLKKLVLTNCIVYLGIFKDLSFQLPSLTYLDMDYCQFVSKNGMKDSHDNDFFPLYMPHTRFHYLSLGVRCDKYNRFCLKLINGRGATMYFKGKLGGGALTYHRKVYVDHLDSYLSSRYSDKTATIELHCTSIKKLKVYINYTEFQIDCFE
jgi:hypothetical protein